MPSDVKIQGVSRLSSEQFSDKKECKTKPDFLWQSQYTFFNPDYTVGFGITPNPALSRPRTVTADREFHPALKTLPLFSCFENCIISGRKKQVFCIEKRKRNRFFLLSLPHSFIFLTNSSEGSWYILKVIASRFGNWRISRSLISVTCFPKLPAYT